jgi:hypothetical protein
MLLAAMLVFVGACGGDDQPAQSDQPPAAAPTAPGSEQSGAGSPDGGGGSEPGSPGAGAGSATGAQGSGERAARSRERRLRGRARRLTGPGKFKGANRPIYYEARSRCLSIPLRSLARGYGAESDDPREVARAYAAREAPTGRFREAAITGCLDGIKFRLR